VVGAVPGAALLAVPPKLKGDAEPVPAVSVEHQQTVMLDL